MVRSFDAPDAGSALRAEFVAAFPVYVRERVAELGVDPDSIGPSIRAGGRWLDVKLRELLDQPARSQRQSPLELFRNALAFPTDALKDAGVEARERDATAADVVPGDQYDLAPASSRALGEAAWKAHIAWGIAKAESVAGMVLRSAVSAGARDAVALLGTNLMDRTSIGEAVASAGHELEVWRNPAAVTAGIEQGVPVMTLIDLTHPAADDAIRMLSDAGGHVIAFGPHVDDVAMTRAKALGATDVLPRSRFFRRLPGLLPKRT